MKWILSRLVEPSTLAGIALILQGFVAVAADPKSPQAWASALGGVLAVVVPEKGGGNA